MATRKEVEMRALVLNALSEMQRREDALTDMIKAIQVSQDRVHDAEIHLYRTVAALNARELRTRAGLRIACDALRKAADL